MKNYANLFFRSSVSILQSRIINAKCGLFLCVNLLLFIYCPTLKAQVKNDNFLTNVDEKNTVLSASQRTKFDKIKQSKTYESTQIVKIGNIRSLEKERVLPVNLPTQKGVLLAERTFLEAVSDQEFKWSGVFKNADGNIFINSTKEGIFGRIIVGDEVYNIEDIGNGNSLLLKIAPSTFTPDECGSTSDGSEMKQETMAVERNVCTDLPIRVGVLFTQNAQNTGLNMSNLLQTAIVDLNTILTNSGISSNTASFESAGLQFLSGFTESLSPCGDADLLAGNTSAIQFRNNIYNRADLVILLTDGDYGDILGCVSQIGPNDNAAFAVVEIESANANFTFAHEVIHLLGGRHQQCNIFSGSCDDAPGYKHGFGYRTGPWPFRQERTTLMHSLRYSWQRVRELSSPPNKGTSDRNDNARMVTENACTVAQFRPNPMSISINGPTQMYENTYEQFCAEINNCSNIQNIEWAVATNGWDYIPQSSALCFEHFFTGSFENIIRLTVTCADGLIRTTYKYVYRIGNEPPSIPQLTTELPSEKIEILAYPNPATDELNISVANPDEKTIQLFLTDWSGRKISVKQDNDPNNEYIHCKVSTTNLHNGMYVLTCVSLNKTLSKLIYIHHE